MKKIILIIVSFLFINHLFGQNLTQHNKVDSTESSYDIPLQKQLLEIYKEDQEPRKQMNELVNKYGYKSPEVDSLINEIKKKDKINLEKVIDILENKGWVGTDKVGLIASVSLFLVIQHADLKTQEKYLPMMRDAVKKGNASKNNLALLEDRVALGRGNKQIYGSQLHFDQKTQKLFVAPLEDPDNVDKRREEMGLSPMSEYVKSFNITWDVGAYKKLLSEYEKVQQEMLNNK